MTSYFQVKNTVKIEKNLKETFLQLRCANVLLHFEYINYSSVSQKLRIEEPSGSKSPVSKTSTLLLFTQF